MLQNTSVRLRIVVCALMLLAAVVMAAERGGPASTQPTQAQAGSAEAAKLLQAAICVRHAIVNSYSTAS